MNSRLTTQRIKIMEFLRSTKEHPSAEMVYNAVSKDLPSITLATVYRNLNKLSEQGEIIRLDIGGEYRFDGHMHSHIHAVCEKCGSILDFDEEEVHMCALKNVPRSKFTAKSVRIVCYGTCNKCNKKPS